MFRRKEKASSGEVVIAGSQAGASNYSTQGIYGIKICHDPEDAVADIVFIHGLTGNRETTWTDKTSGTFWPENLLPKDVPRARIMTFGYDADVVHFWAMASQNCIGNHTSNLVNTLAQLRERTETQDRPIIFVTHSLGGLVFEDAMLLSRNSAESHIRNLVECTIGVCFLGTPHCGASAANWASILGSLTNVLKTTNKNLLNVLRPDSDVLARIQTQFHTMLRANKDRGKELKITCFFEELPVRGVGEIVPKSSAILPGYNHMGIHNNHMDMTKFADSQDPGYLNVSSEIMRWFREIQNNAQQTQHVPLITTESTPRLSVAEERNSAPGTSNGLPGQPPENLMQPVTQLAQWQETQGYGPGTPSPYQQTQSPPQQYYPLHGQYPPQQQYPFPIPSPQQSLVPSGSQAGRQGAQDQRTPSPYQQPQSPPQQQYLPQQQYSPYHQYPQQPSPQPYQPQYPPHMLPTPGYSPQPQPQSSPPPQLGNAVYHNYGTGKQVVGSTFNGNVTF